MDLTDVPRTPDSGGRGPVLAPGRVLVIGAVGGRSNRGKAIRASVGAVDSGRMRTNGGGRSIEDDQPGGARGPVRQATIAIYYIQYNHVHKLAWCSGKASQ